MDYLDTRDLLEKRRDLQESILDAYNDEFENVEEFSEIPSITDDCRIGQFLEYWDDELETIEEINKVEEEVDNYSADSFEFGTTLIAKSDFTEFCKEDLEDCGLLPKDLPYFIENNIDWDGVADNLMVDYTEVEYLGVTYLFR